MSSPPSLPSSLQANSEEAANRINRILVFILLHLQTFNQSIRFITNTQYMANISKKPRPWEMTFFLSDFFSFSSSQTRYWANSRFNVLKTSIVGSDNNSKKILLNKTLRINTIILLFDFYVQSYKFLLKVKDIIYSINLFLYIHPIVQQNRSGDVPLVILFFMVVVQ